MSLLELRGVDKIFGGLHAVRGVSFKVEKGSIFGLIGPNGAGKTTLFNVITGVYTPEHGEILFAGKNIAGLRPALIAARGVARTFQNIRIFRAMTVAETVMVAGHHLHSASILDSMLRTRRYEADEQALSKRAHELLEILGLADLASEIAGSLPYGSQRRLEIARGLMLSPELLLLDEPAAGMNSLIFSFLAQIGSQHFGVKLDLRLPAALHQQPCLFEHRHRARQIACGGP